MRGKTLDPTRIVETLRLLANRINERFDGSGLSRLCADLLAVGEQAQQRANWIASPLLWLRALTGVIVLAIVLGSVGGVIVGLRELPPAQDRLTLSEFVQMLEAGTNDVVFVGVAIFFLVTLETRIKRRRALAAIHELRSIAHIIDMHQLTKDPERTTRHATFTTTESSPRAQMSQFELRRYLDYCAEMLSLTGKVAALYVQRFDDGVALAAVNEVEALATGLSQKIWQKIMILHSFPQGDETPPADFTPE